MSPQLLFSGELWEPMLRGLLITLQLSVLSYIGGFAIGVPLGIVRSGRGRSFAQFFAILYVFTFRSIPILVLLFLVYYGAPNVWLLRHSFLWDLFLRSPYWTAIVVLTIANGAYFAEIILGGIRSVKPGLVESGLAIGLTSVQAYRRIILPLALRNSLLALGNEAIFIVKTTSVASILTVHDVLGEANYVGRSELDNFSPLIAAAAVYLVLVQSIEIATSFLARKLRTKASR